MYKISRFTFTEIMSIVEDETIDTSIKKAQKICDLIDKEISDQNLSPVSAVGHPRIQPKTLIATKEVNNVAETVPLKKKKPRHARALGSLGVTDDDGKIVG